MENGEMDGWRLEGESEVGEVGEVGEVRIGR